MVRHEAGEKKQEALGTEPRPHPEGNGQTPKSFEHSKDIIQCAFLTDCSHFRLENGLSECKTRSRETFRKFS